MDKNEQWTKIYDYLIEKYMFIHKLINKYFRKKAFLPFYEFLVKKNSFKYIKPLEFYKLAQNINILYILPLKIIAKENSLTHFICG